MTHALAQFSPTNERIRRPILNPIRLAALLAAVLGVVLPSPALAYIGPGAGLGAIAVTVALLLGVVLLVIGLVWYPLKRLLKRNASGGRRVRSCAVVGPDRAGSPRRLEGGHGGAVLDDGQRA